MLSFQPKGRPDQVVSGWLARRRRMLEIGTGVTKLPIIGWMGSGLARPESVLTTSAGWTFACDRRGGVAAIRPDGETFLDIGIERPDGFLPNGISLAQDGSILLADHGVGGVWRLFPGGRLQPFLLEVEGAVLPSTNFVLQDAGHRTWITVSTWLQPRERGLSRSHASGTIILCDRLGSRVVADGLGWANEVALHPDGRHLYINETMRRRTSRFPLLAHGGLGRGETVIEYGEGIWPDGLAFDVEGGLWVASVASNRILRVDPEGGVETLFASTPSEAVARAESDYQNECFTRASFDVGAPFPPYNLTSLAFGGPDRRHLYVGCLGAERLMVLESPLSGFPPPHWMVPVSPWEDARR